MKSCLARQHRTLNLFTDGNVSGATQKITVTIFILGLGLYCRKNESKYRREVPGKLDLVGSNLPQSGIFCKGRESTVEQCTADSSKYNRRIIIYCDIH